MVDPGLRGLPADAIRLLGQQAAGGRSHAGGREMGGTSRNDASGTGASMIRHRPVHRRAHETIAIVHEQQRYKIGLGRELACIERERLGPIVEVFLNAQKVNSQLDVLAHDGAILMSLLLQYGCPPAVIYHAMKRNPDASMASPLGRAAAYLVEEEKRT